MNLAATTVNIQCGENLAIFFRFYAVEGLNYFSEIFSVTTNILTIITHCQNILPFLLQESV
jgi:hypothetical protein